MFYYKHQENNYVSLAMNTRMNK